MESRLKESAAIGVTALDFRPLPIRVKYGHRELAQSYVRRALERNGLPERRFMTRLVISHRGVNRGDPNKTVRTLAQQFGQLSNAHLDHALAAPAHSDGSTCVRCLMGFTERLGCHACGDGSTFEQYAHVGHFVCKRHKLWTGPGARKRDQVPIGADVLAADESFNRLYRSGRLSPPTFIEIEQIIDRWARLVDTKLTPPEAFVLSMKLARLITSNEFHHQIGQPHLDVVVAYGRLADAVDRLQLKCDVPITDGLWLLLRPSLLAVREKQANSVRSPVFTDPHELVLGVQPKKKQPPSDFALFFSPMRTCPSEQWLDFHARRFHFGVHANTRYEARALGSGSKRFICARGHRFAVDPRHLIEAMAHGNEGCRFCQFDSPSHTEPSLATEFPAVAADWCHELNGELKPEYIRSKSRKLVWWICRYGHEPYRLNPSMRAAGRGCTTCSPIRTGVPDSLASEWDRVRNTQGPEKYGSWSRHVAWWVCAKHGHSYAMAIAHRNRGTGCPYCYGRSVLAGYNDLESTHTQLAKEWDMDKNDLRPSDVLAKSGSAGWWICPKGHSFRAIIRARAKQGSGCPVCARGGLEPGRNDLLSQHPYLAQLWDSAANSELRPDQVAQFSWRMVAWTCPVGHSFLKRPADMVRSRGQCSVCGVRPIQTTLA